VLKHAAAKAKKRTAVPRDRFREKLLVHLIFDHGRLPMLAHSRIKKHGIAAVT
jgi:hypothetical protein